MDASQHWYPEIVQSGSNTSYASYTYRRLAKCSETLPTSFWVQRTRMDVSKLWYPEMVHLGPKHKFSKFICAEGQLNHLKYSQTSFCTQWTRMDALQLWYHEIVHSRSKTSFASFTCRRLAKYSETLPNIILVPMD
jgi:hypothetical protein